MRSHAFLVAALVAAVFAAPQGQTPAPPAPADLVLRNGHLVTVDDRQPEAQAMASRGGRIVAVGSNDEIARLVGPSTRVIDLAGQLAIPGFIEGHGHFTGIGENRINLDLMSTTSWEQIVQMVAQAVERARPGEWIIGRGWHQDKWTRRPDPNVEGFPLHAALDRVSPNNPVVLTHASGHASFVNKKALDDAGITRSTPNPTGGEVLKDAAGEPTGLLRETASGLVRSPSPDEAAMRRILTLADEEVVGKGITSFQDAGSSFATVDLMKKMADDGSLQVRLWVMLRAGNAALRTGLDRYRMIGAGDQHLTVRAIKVTADGALGSRGAWLLEPYADKLDSTGLAPAAVQTLPETARIALEHDMQLCVHAIGDRANREVLNIYEAAFKERQANGKNLRWRIEHAQHINAADIPRFGQLGVIASMQSVHATSDGGWVPDRLGASRSEEGAYVWQKLMKSGAVVTNGTDAPVENVDPIPNYYSAVTRKLGDGRTFYPDQRLTRMEALRSYTILNAFAAFEEDVKGSLTVGKLADITVLSKDITTVPDEEIRSARVVYTIVGGKVVFAPVNLKQVLLRNLTLQSLSQAVGLACGMAVSLILARSLGTAGFGAFNYVFAYLYFWLSFNDLGINTIVIREISKDESRTADIVGAMMVFRLLLSVSLVLLASVVTLLMPMAEGVKPAILLFLWLLPLSAVSLVQSIFQARLHLGASTLADIANRVSGLVLLLAALKAGWGLTGVFGALLAGEAIGATMMFVSSRRYVQLHLHVDVALWREVLRSSLPLGTGILLGAVVNRLDFLMLERMAGLEQVGLYSVAYKVTNLFERFPMLVSATLYPVMSKLAATDRPRLIAVYRGSIRHLAAIAIPAALLITWLAPEIVVVFGAQYADAALGLRVLVWSSVCLYLALIGGNVLISIGRERLNMLTLIAGAATNVILNLLWIPRWGFVGAAAATVAAFVVILVTTGIAVERYLRD